MGSWTYHNHINAIFQHKLLHHVKVAHIQLYIGAQFFRAWISRAMYNISKSLPFDKPSARAFSLPPLPNNKTFILQNLHKGKESGVRFKEGAVS